MTVPWGSSKIVRREFDGDASTPGVLYTGVAGKHVALVRVQATTSGPDQLRIYEGSNVLGNRLINHHSEGSGGIPWAQYDKESAPVVASGVSIGVAGGSAVAVVIELLQYDD